jgi:UDP-GlcNAc:undecaprenyl-phosphate GlcNAc-1-phosphate transferase
LLYLNFKNKIFLGDSGTLFLGFVISYYAIMIYEKNNLFNVEDIFLMMMIPGIDMFRLFLFRIFKNKNPFIGDNLHLHHLILNKFDQKISFFSIFFFNTVIFYFSYFLGIVFYAIVFNFIIYVVAIIYLLKFKTSKRVK